MRILHHAGKGSGRLVRSAARQRGHSLLSGDVGKLIEKHFEGIACLQVIEEVLERHSGSNENRFACENLRIGMDDFVLAHDVESTSRAETSSGRSATLDSMLR